MREQLLLVINRYRTYDRLMYEILAAAFDLAVIWISPAPATEPLPNELVGQFETYVVAPSQAILKPSDARRNVALFRLVRRVGRGRDLIVASTSDSWKARVVYAAARASRVPIAFRKEKWYGSNLPATARGLYRRLQQLLTDHLEHHGVGVLVGGSRTEEYLVRRGLSPDRVEPFRYLHPDLGECALDPSVVERLCAFKGERVAFLYLGRVMRQKGLRTLISAFLTVRKSGRDAVLFVVGAPITSDDGRGKVSLAYYDECVSLAAREPRVMFFPPAPPDRVQDFYAAADVFVHPHVQTLDGVDVYDGWGNVITEAASMGMPIIGTDRVASAFDLIDANQNGYLVSTADLEVGLVTAMQRFVDTPEIIPAFGAHSRRRFEDFVDPKINVASIRRLIERARAA